MRLFDGTANDAESEMAKVSESLPRFDDVFTVFDIALISIVD